MSNQTRKVKPGDEVDVLISGDDEAQDDGSLRERRRGGAFTEDEDDPIYVFKKKSITFYDLGTRLRSVAPTTFDRLRRQERPDPIPTDPHDGYYNEYVELDLEQGKNINSFGLTLGEIAAIEGELLRGDPFGHSEANGTSRPVPNVMQIPYEAEWLYLDMVLYSGANETRVPLGQPDKRPFLNQASTDPPEHGSKKWKLAAADLTHERWNPLNISGGSIGHEGVYSGTFSGKHLRVECAAHYEALDTGDTSRFKWTLDPSFGATGVDGPKLSGNTRVFLRPRIHHTSFGYVMESNTGGHATPGQAQLLTRLPAYPLAGKLVRQAFGTEGNRMVITRGFARAGSASLERSTILPVDRTAEEASDLAIIGGSSFVRYRGNLAYTGGFGFDGRSQPVIQGMLLGIVDTGGKTYYGWASADYNPVARRAFIVGEQSASFIAGASLPVSNWQCPPYLLYTGADDATTTVDNASRAYQA